MTQITTNEFIFHHGKRLTGMHDVFACSLIYVHSMLTMLGYVNDS
jgi:hypothetical protein